MSNPPADACMGCVHGLQKDIEVSFSILHFLYETLWERSVGHGV